MLIAFLPEICGAALRQLVPSSPHAKWSLAYLQNEARLGCSL
jgi:hypothetical protein